MLTIYGGSDDLVELEGIVRDELDTSDVVITVGWPDGDPSKDLDPQGVRVRMQYAPDWQDAASIPACFECPA